MRKRIPPLNLAQIEAMGKTMTLKQIGAELGVSVCTIWRRVTKHGLSYRKKTRTLREILAQNFGKLRDAEIARLTGVSRQRIGQLKRQGRLFRHPD